MQEAYGKSTTSLVCTEDCQDWNCSTLKVNNMYDVGYYSNHSTWYMDIFVFTILQDYRLLIPGAGQPGAARSSRLLQMVYVRCVLRLMDTGSYTEQGQDRVWSHLNTVSFNKRISHDTPKGQDLSRK